MEEIEQDGEVFVILDTVVDMEHWASVAEKCREHGVELCSRVAPSEVTEMRVHTAFYQITVRKTDLEKYNRIRSSI